MKERDAKMEEEALTPVSESFWNDLQHIINVLDKAYTTSTKSTYGSGLYVFHLFCQYKHIEERHRALVDPQILASFISTLAGTYGGSTIRNYICGI